MDLLPHSLQLYQWWQMVHELFCTVRLTHDSMNPHWSFTIFYLPWPLEVTLKEMKKPLVKSALNKAWTFKLVIVNALYWSQRPNATFNFLLQCRPASYQFSLNLSILYCTINCDSFTKHRDPLMFFCGNYKNKLFDAVLYFDV